MNPLNRQIGPKIMPRLAQRFAPALLAILSASQSMAQDNNSDNNSGNNPYWDEYGNAPVMIQQTNNGASQTLKFVGFENGMLVAELDGGVGEVSLPVSESMVRDLRLDNSGMSEINRLISEGNHGQALERLRPKAYPLIKFHALPASFTQLHLPIRRLIESLIATGEFNEAEDIIRNRMRLDQTGTEYSELAIGLMRAYLAGSQFDNAAKMTAVIPVNGPYSGNIAAIVDAADALRAAGKYEAVIPLYRAIENVVPDAAKQNVQMWLAYSLVLAGRVDEATPMIDEIAEPAPGDRLFSLYKLLEGSREHRAGDYGKALDLLTRGFVRAQTSFSWVPEMLYLIGDCYERADDPLAARNVWTEIVILYPESPYKQRAETSLAQLPEVDQTAVE